MSRKDSEYEWPEEMIRRLRLRARPGKQTKLRQIDLSKKLGIETRTVQKWENGERLPSAHNLQKLIQLFLEEDIFLTGQEKQEAMKLWKTVSQFYNNNEENYRVYPKFDEQWFDSLKINRESKIDKLEEPYPKTKNVVDRKVQTNLPAQMYGFIGREKQMQSIMELLANVPVVTLAGPGGIGKTRMAFQIASMAVPTYSDGVWLMELSSATDLVSMMSIVASVLGVTNKPESMLLESILEKVRDKKILLVLDNCEHLINPCAELIESLLTVSSKITILVTSQEPLNIETETVWRVPPLTFPTFNEEEKINSTDIMEYESIQLFMKRATSMIPDYEISLEERILVARICERLEGIPLAIELAAARTPVLSLKQIEKRLSNLFTLLNFGKRTAISRHQTLRATIEWSYSLLTNKEKLLLQRLSVFTNGFGLEAVEEVCSSQGDTGHTVERIDKEEVLDLVWQLVNKSLVSIDKLHANKGIRYRLLGLIKQFAKETWNTSQEEQSSVLERYLRYYHRFLEQEEKKFRSKDRDAALKTIRREYPNIRSALGWSLSQPKQISTSSKMAACLYFYWLHEGSLDEGIRWLKKVLELHKGTFQSDSIRILHGLGILLWVRGDLEDAYTYAKQSVEESTKLEYYDLLSTNLRLLAQILLHQGNKDKAESLAEQSVQYYREQNDKWNLASSLSCLGNVLFIQGKLVHAEQILKESVLLFEEIKDYWELSGPLRGLGYIFLDKQDSNQAVAYFKRSIAVCQSYQGDWVISRGLEGLASAACTIGDYRKTAILLGAAEMIREKIGSSIMPQFQKAYDVTIKTIKSNYDHDLFVEAWNLGKAMTKEQVVAYALES
ncbi:tetratricopeptide repeat protein [Shimazuella sp. AN120528]|uniref:tetratricopeptide repeat protein n=1 Tax=Shimazuella soli TaxID=1892854 RepID=UPI001F10FCD8|nr:tetratricopeptide repeat protein [Shimazuella soli]MCH5585759.1 tetratricopeptide repeat protein [Shimazuella soli]